MSIAAASILVAVIAAIPGVLAFLAVRRKDEQSVFVQRDSESWKRMLDSVARADKDLADLRVAYASVRAHADECDKALAAAMTRIETLERHEARRARAEG